MARVGAGTEIEVGRGTTPTWTELDEIKDVTLPSSQADMHETTHMKSTGRRKEFKAGFKDSGESAIEMNWNPGSATDNLLLAIAESGEDVQIRYTIPTPTEANTAAEFVETWAATLQNYERTDPVNGVSTATATFKISVKIS